MQMRLLLFALALSLSGCAERGAPGATGAEPPQSQPSDGESGGLPTPPGNDDSAATPPDPGDGPSDADPPWPDTDGAGPPPEIAELRFASLPGAGASLPYLDYVEVTASHPDGIDFVELFVDGTLLRRENHAPYEWMLKTDPSLNWLEAGPTVLEAVATDTKGSVSSVTLQVEIAQGASGGGLCKTETSAAVFRHPGIVDTCRELATVKARIARRDEPWVGWYGKFLDSTVNGKRIADPAPWTPSPVEAIRQDYNTDNAPLSVDSSACIAQALAWIYGDRTEEVHAQNVMTILDGWRSKLKTIDTWRNGRLVAGWHLPKLFRCAELVQYTYDGWTPEFEAKLKPWMRQVLLPALTALGHDDNGNWRTSGVEAMLAAAVFLDDAELFLTWSKEWREALTDFILRADGATWESCRDAGHTSFALNGLLYGALTLFNQGQVDVFSLAGYRLYAGFEYAANIANGNIPEALPPLEGRETCHWDKHRPWTWGGHSLLTHYELYDQRAYLDLTQTRILTGNRGPEGHAMSWGWETLRHGQPPP